MELVKRLTEQAVTPGTFIHRFFHAGTAGCTAHARYVILFHNLCLLISAAIFLPFPENG